ncbi:hypothetical protein ACFL0Y_01395 [Patescibacteria group bacterium]
MKKIKFDFNFRPDNYKSIFKGEVVIACIYYTYAPLNTISLYIKAKQKGNKFTYRLDDAEAKEFQYCVKPIITNKPLSLLELIQFIDSVQITTSDFDEPGLTYAHWQSIYESSDDLKEILSHPKVGSDYYAQLSKYYRQEAQKYYDEKIKEREEELKDEISLGEKYQKLKGKKLLLAFQDWYADGAKFPSPDANIFHSDKDFLSNVLKNRGGKVLALLTKSKLKNKSEILSSIMNIAHQPYKTPPGSMWGNLGVGYFNRGLGLIKKEVIPEKVVNKK